MPMKIAALPRPVARSKTRWAHALAVAVAVIAACLFTAGCMKRGGPTNVASGQIYAPGEPTYDEFFKSFYGVQLLMGQAPDREKAVKQKLTKIAEVSETASADELSSGMEKRLDGLAKKGVAAKVSTTALDGNDPEARVVAAGTAADDETVKALDQAVKDGITLLTELRHAKPELARLKEALPPLKPKVDEAFSNSSHKKKEVQKNLEDAQQLLPLMSSRGDEVDARVVELFRALEKASPAAVAVPPAALPDPAAKKDKKGAPKKAAGEPKPKPKSDKADKPPAEPKPPKPPPEPKAAEPPKPAKPKPAEDFEP